jgi:peptidoglycan/xylan/chitin deacetylase (PgdA/CDA1 family)
MAMNIYDSTQAYPRDLIGYGKTVPHAAWPNASRIALQFVLNYEEGGESSVLHGDTASEQFLSEMFNAVPSQRAIKAWRAFMNTVHERGCGVFCVSLKHVDCR